MRNGFWRGLIAIGERRLRVTGAAEQRGEGGEQHQGTADSGHWMAKIADLNVAGKRWRLLPCDLHPCLGVINIV